MIRTAQLNVSYNLYGQALLVSLGESLDVCVEQLVFMKSNSYYLGKLFTAHVFIPVFQ